MRPFLSLVLILCILSCSRDEQEQELTVQRFEADLKADMKFEKIVEIFGHPQDDIGSGIHIYVYRLNDNTEIRIGYIDRIFYARHYDASGKLLKEII